MTPLQKNIKKLLELHSLSIAEAERKSGLKTYALRNILRGISNNPKIETLNKLSIFFNCSVSDLTGLHDISDNSIPVLKFDLLNDCTNYIKKASQDIAYELSFAEYINLLSKSYSYSLKNNKGKLDEGFLEFLIEKEL